MSFATDIIRCPSRNASCDRISQQPMWPDTVTVGLFAASQAFPAADISPAASTRAFAWRHVQNACPIDRAMFR